jgi:outer membrane protein TolC
LQSALTIALRFTLRACGVVSIALPLSGCTTFDPEPEFSAVNLAAYTPSFVAANDSSRDAGEIRFAHVAVPVRLRALKDIKQLREDEIHRLSLAEALHTALANVAMVRDRHSFLSPGSALFDNPDQVASAYDVPIQQSSPWSAEAALAAFDASLTAGGQWGRNALVPYNAYIGANFPARDVFVTESGSLFGRIDKPLATGTLFSLVHGWNYSPTAAVGNPFNTRYAGFLRGEVRQPLWAGFGREFTDVAGPAVLRSGAGALGRGVVVARLDEKLSVDEFEQHLQVLLKQTEELYWDLWLAHEECKSHAAARDAAEEIWKRTQNRGEAGLVGGEAVDEAQAQEYYFDRKQQADDALAEFFKLEDQLRRLIGLSSDDTRLILPADEPPVAELVPDWNASVAEALISRVELRQQKTRLEMLELQLRAARNLAHPQLDLVSGVQMNGAGERLWRGSGPASAYESLLETDEPGWNVGVEFSMPLGLNAQRTQVRNLENRLAKARALLHEQEREIGHELTHALYELDRAYLALETSARRREAARHRLAAVQADHEAGRSSLDLLLRSQLALSQAEVAYARAVVAYNRAILELQFRKGAVLNHNDVMVADGEEIAAGEVAAPAP